MRKILTELSIRTNTPVLNFIDSWLLRRAEFIILPLKGGDMEKKMRNAVVALLALAVAVGAWVNVSFADETFNVTFAMDDGSRLLELRQDGPAEKAVNITITSGLAKQYVVRQAVDVKKDDGVTLGNNFTVRAFMGTNALGHLYLDSSDRPVSSIADLYISTPAGDPDTFTLIYGIKQPQDLDPGIYSGTIKFIMTPTDSTQAPVFVDLNVTVNINEEPSGSGKPWIEIKASDGGANSISLNPDKQGKGAKDFIVNRNRKFSGPFVIKQVLVKTPQNEAFENLDPRKLEFEVKDAGKDRTTAIMPTPLSENEQVIYTSGPGGEADESFGITYGTGDLSEQGPGTYKSGIRLRLYYNNKEYDLALLDLAVEKESIFALNVKLDQNKIKFDIKPDNQPQDSEVFFTVKSNRGNKFQVSQRVLQPLTNQDPENYGAIMPVEYFTMRAKSDKVKGKFAVSGGQKVDSTPLYSSDAKGSSADFSIIYTINCKDVPPGKYTGRIVFDLIEN